MKIARRARRGFKACQSGTASAEFALVLPCLITLLLGLVDVHLASTTHRRLDHVAQAAVLTLAQDRDSSVSTAELNALYTLIDGLLWPLDSDDVAITVASFTRSDDATTRLWQAERPTGDGAAASAAAPGALDVNGRSGIVVGLSIAGPMTIGFLTNGGRIDVEVNTSPVFGVALKRGA